VRQTQAPHNTGDTVRDVLEYYRCYLSRNRDLADHSTQFMKRENSDPKAAESEAVVFSWLRAEKLGHACSKTQALAVLTSSALTLAVTASLSRRHHWIQRWSRSGLVYRQRLPAPVEARLVLSLTS
jgi:hypothetical protein